MQPLFSLEVCDILTARQLIQASIPTKIISLLSPEQATEFEFTSQGTDHKLWLMDDVTFSAPGSRAPSVSQILEILDFSKTFQPNDKALIHCYAGVSRSTSVAIGVLCQHGVPPSDSISVVEKLCEGMDPNELILRHFDAALGLKLTLLDAYKCWAQTQNGRLMNTVPKHSGAELERNAREYYSQMSLRVPIHNMDQ